MRDPVRITKQDLAQKVQEGWKKPQLAEHYGLPVAQVTKLLKDADLRIRKFHKPKYILVNEPSQDQEESPSTDNIDVIDVEEVQSETEIPVEEPTW